VTVTSHLGPLPVGQAMHALGITHRDQVNKLIDSGLIPVAGTTPSGQRRLDPAAVLKLAARPYAPIPDPSGTRLVAAHLGPLRPDPNGTANQRTHLGYHVNPAAIGLALTPQQLEDAWAGLWPCNPPGKYVGWVLLGDVSGFVVTAGMISGYRIINRSVRFDLSALSPEDLARYTSYRITANRGALLQAL
jgi:hypothetical protein